MNPRRGNGWFLSGDATTPPVVVLWAVLGAAVGCAFAGLAGALAVGMQVPLLGSPLLTALAVSAVGSAAALVLVVACCVEFILFRPAVPHGPTAQHLAVAAFAVAALLHTADFGASVAVFAVPLCCGLVAAASVA